MKKVFEAVVLAALLGAATAADATPSTTFWTPTTTYTQPYMVPHVTYDTYVGEKGQLQNDYGLTIGVLPWEKLQGEVGVDVFLPGLQFNGAQTGTSDNLFLNARLTLPENAYSPWQPGLSVGVQSVGFKKNYSDYDHMYAVLGKTFEYVGNVNVGGYYGGNKHLYATSTPGKFDRAGFMAAWTSPDLNVKLPGLEKVAFLADYSSGNNVFGAFGAGIGLYFTPSIDILTGPVFFNDPKLIPGYSSMLWTIQLDIDVDIIKKAAAPAPTAPKT